MLRSVVALVCLTLPLAAKAQRVTGTVRLAGADAVLSGVVVSALDAEGRSVGRTLSNEAGRYSLQLTPAAVRLRATRIGFRPADAAIARTGTDLMIDLQMDRAPVVLQTMRISSDASCGTSPDGQLVRQVWEQARSALLAAIVAREANPAQVQMLGYSRRMEPRNRLITEQRIVHSSGTATRPVVAARTGAELAASGYMERQGAGNLYFAPDADVLFDESFAEQHCFGLTPGTGARVGQLGLTFAPRRSRGDLVDVSGTLWIDPQKPELVDLHFRYTGLDQAATAAGAGGALYFRTMANGVVFVESWSILVPTLTEVVTHGARGRTTSRDVVSEFVETGGYITRSTWPDGTRWSDPLGALRGRVTEEKTGKSVSRVSVSTTGADETTNASGAYAFAILPPGRYKIGLVDSVFADYVKPRLQSREVVIARGDTVTLDFRIRSRDALLGDICRAEVKPGGTVVLLGRIIDRSSNLPSGMQIAASWYFNGAGGDDVNLDALKRQGSVTDVTANGRFALCIPRRSSAITLRAMVNRVEIADTVVSAVSETPGDIPALPFEWVIPDGAAGAALPEVPPIRSVEWRPPDRALQHAARESGTPARQSPGTGTRSRHR